MDFKAHLLIQISHKCWVNYCDRVRGREENTDDSGEISAIVDMDSRLLKTRQNLFLKELIIKYAKPKQYYK